MNKNTLQIICIMRTWGETVCVFKMLFAVFCLKVALSWIISIIVVMVTDWNKLLMFLDRF